MYEVVVADDNEMDREILGAFLKGKFHITEAESGSEALDCIEAKKERIAFLLLDLQMPQMNGFDVMDEMKKKKLQGLFPVILMTAEENREILTEGMRRGASEVIRKPFSPSVLRYIIEKYRIA